MVVTEPKVEFLWWRGCPSWDLALERLRGQVAEAGLDPDAIELHEIETDADAAGAGFVGSPTIRIGGRDVQAPESGEPLGLNCRIYRRRDGRVSPMPDPDDIRDALAEAIEGDTR
jgi:hypothetical protein